MIKSKRKHHDSKKNYGKKKFAPYNAHAKAEDEELTKILFGGAEEFLKSLDKLENVEKIDEKEVELKAAWSDDEDNEINVGQALNAQGRTLPSGGINTETNKYKQLLEHKFKSLNGTQNWASLSNKTKNEDSLLIAGILKKHESKYLSSSNLIYKKMKDLNCETYNEGPFVNSIEFLSNSNVGIVGGQSGIASLFVVDGKKNSKLHNVKFENYPIFSTNPIESRNEVIFGSRYKFVYSYDLITAKVSKLSLPPGLTNCKKSIISPDEKYLAISGKFGEIYLLTTQSKEKICVLKQISEVTSLTFNSTSSLLYSHSDTGEITVFDMNMRRVKHKFKDDGCLNGTTIDISSTNQFIAAGSAQGIVNIYDTESVFKSNNPTPRKILTNLTTGINCLKFNPTSEILAFSSIDLPNAVKLYHVNSSNVFPNFPTLNTNVGYVNVMNFSPNSGYIAFGNKKSVVSLYKLDHFKNY